MPKKQMISKACPKCEQQVPVACKACRCGYSFFKAKKSVNTPTATPADTRRRTQRVRREKPNYYDSLEFEKQVKKTTRTSRISECDDDDALIKPKPKKRKNPKTKEEEEEEEPIQNLTGDKQLQCMIILAELNRKMGVVTWKSE